MGSTRGDSRVYRYTAVSATETCWEVHGAVGHDQEVKLIDVDAVQDQKDKAIPISNPGAIREQRQQCLPVDGLGKTE